MKMDLPRFILLHLKVSIEFFFKKNIQKNYVFVFLIFISFIVKALTWSLNCWLQKGPIRISRMIVDLRRMILLLKIVMISISKEKANFTIVSFIFFPVVQRFPGFNPSTVSRATISQTPIPDFFIDISQWVQAF